MKKYFFILFLTFSQFVIAQKIVKTVMVGNNGITEDVQKAKYLIVVKKYSDTAFERLEYNFTGPMKRRLTYKDSLLKTLNGNYANFFPSGFISSGGNYLDNKKEGRWFVYDDSGHAQMGYNYHLDKIMNIINIDSLSEEQKKIEKDTTGKHEAFYKGGEKKYLNYIYQNLKVPNRTENLMAGGTVRVRFIIDEDGRLRNVQIRKSVEFAFDEEVIRVVSSAKDWIPANINGKKIKAYREQPISVSFK